MIWKNAVTHGCYWRTLSSCAFSLVFVALLTYEPTVSAFMHGAFDDKWDLLLALFVVFVANTALMCLRTVIVLNTLMMIAVTAAMSVFTTGVHVVFATNAPLFACLQYTLSVFVLAFLQRFSHKRFAFLFWPVESFLAFLVILIASCTAHTLRPGLVSDLELAYSNLAQSVLIAWTGYDTSLVFQGLHADESHLGAIYFPIHFVIFLGILCILAMLSIPFCFVVGVGSVGGGCGGCGGNCSGCGGCKCPKCCSRCSNYAAKCLKRLKCSIKCPKCSFKCPKVAIKCPKCSFKCPKVAIKCPKCSFKCPKVAIKRRKCHEWLTKGLTICVSCSCWCCMLCWNECLSWDMDPPYLPKRHARSTASHIVPIADVPEFHEMERS